MRPNLFGKSRNLYKMADFRWESDFLLIGSTQSKQIAVICLDWVGSFYVIKALQYKAFGVLSR